MVCNVRQGWSQEEVQSLIKVYDVYVSNIDSADGVDMKIAWENTSSKTIKYVYFTVEAYNAVNDKVYCEIRDYNTFTGSSTGPFAPGYSTLIYDATKDKYSVNTVWEDCYYNATIKYFVLTNIRIIYMDNSEVEIGSDYVNYAFSEIKSLKTVSLPSTIKYIGDKAFYECSSLLSVSIPSQVTSIGDYAFSYCTGLTSITIPDSVTSIGTVAFYHCTGLTSVTIGNSVTTIGGSAFSGCSNLISITIPDSVTSIDPFAFSDCTSLTSVTIGKGVTSISGSVFSDCTGLTGVYISDIAAWCGIEFVGSESNPLCYAGNLYLNGELVTDLVIPDGVTSIGAHVFSDCTSLASITIPDSVTRIGYFAFSDCTSLTRVVFKSASGWYYTSSSDYSGGCSVDVSDPTAAAKYLRRTYVYYFWYRK